MNASYLATIGERVLIALCVLFIVLVVIVLLLPAVGKSEFYHSMDQAPRYPTWVKKLALINQEHTEFPEGIRQLTNLEHLILFGDKNEFDRLPDWLPENSKIVELWLSDCQFRTFPLVLTELTNLQNLRLSRCSISELPSRIGKLKSLEELDLAGNNLTDVPEEISQLVGLKHLDLEGNRLSAEVLKKATRLLPHAQIEFGEQRN